MHQLVVLMDFSVLVSQLSFNLVTEPTSVILLHSWQTVCSQAVAEQWLVLLVVQTLPYRYSSQMQMDPFPELQVKCLLLWQTQMQSLFLRPQPLWLV
jgi:hypothetical protein